MTLLDAARQLADLYTITEVGDYRFVDHTPCYGQDCPHLAMPQVVAALEAAERLIEAGDPVETDRGGRGVCQYCLAPNYVGDYLSFSPSKDVEHEAECPYGALAAALRGESA
jgi:hypothetical protein